MQGSRDKNQYNLESKDNSIKFCYGIFGNGINMSKQICISNPGRPKIYEFQKMIAIDSSHIDCVVFTLRSDPNFVFYLQGDSTHCIF